MKFKTYYLKFKGPLHLGNHRPDSYDTSESFLRSDTLTAAIIASWANMGKSAYIQENNGDPGFAISSAFPFLITSEGTFLHFLPRPKMHFPHSEREIHEDLGRTEKEKDIQSISKKIKKIRWLEQQYFEALICGNSSYFPVDLGHFLQGDFLTAETSAANLIQKEIQNRVVIPRDRQKEDPRPFYMERLYFTENSGLYFMAYGEGSDLRRLEEGLEILQHEGLGTDRNLGNGQFTYTSGNININTPADGSHTLNLSLYCPESAESLQALLGEDSSFSFIKRGGWITTPEFGTYQKNTVHMFEEGSIFNRIENTTSGNPNINLTPPIMGDKQNVYRSGRAIFLPVKL